MGEDERGHHGEQGDAAIDLDFAKLVGPATDQARADEGGGASHQIDDGDVVQRDADVIHGIDGDVGNDREAGKNDQCRKEQGTQMVAVAEHAEGGREQMGALFFADMVA